MSNETNEAEKQSVTDCNHLGDAAKMRDALNETQSVIGKCMEILNRIPDGVEYDGLIDEVADELCDLRESHVKLALSAQARNCDVGKPEEQEGRFEKFCDAHKYAGDDGANICLQDCPCYNNLDCGVRWSQMPYEEGGSNGK